MISEIDERKIERAALIGTAQVQEEIALPPGFVIPDGDPDRTTHQLLLAAGLSSLMRKAGVQPAPPDAFPKWDAAAKETMPGLGPMGVAVLRSIIEEEEQELLATYIGQLEKQKRRIPAEFIVPLMRLASRQRALEQAILMGAGERGLWLARKNTGWSQLLHPEATHDDLWQTGTIAQRAEHLQQARARDPVAARELLSPIISKEAAKDLVAFLDTFATGLSTEDAPLLEPLLRWKSKDVRETTARLLARIKDHPLPEKVFELARPFIELKGNMILGRKFEISLPEAYEKEWQAMGIAPKNVRYPTERTAWLGQMLALIPPQRWYDHFGRDANDLVNYALKSEFMSTLLGGWTDAALLHDDRPMIEALLQVVLKEGPEKHWQLLRSNELWAALPPETTEAILLPAIRRNSRGAEMEVIPLLVLHQHTMSAELSKAIVDWLERIAPSGEERSHWMHLLAQILRRHMSPSVSAHISPMIDRLREKALPTYITALEQLAKRLRLRQRMNDSLNEPPLPDEQ